ncbi:MAG: BMC domain-containing protein [Lutispora sp.]|nr:BMC domain-containing protein [Lutispora sp.]MDD4833850.1 BMC domain-containing protein [Lutispora sp.]
MSREALGMIETRGLTAAIQASDAMVKTANVNISKFYIVGSGFVVSMVKGDVAAVKSAVDAGQYSVEGIGELVACLVLPRPHEDVIKLISLMDLI